MHRSPLIGTMRAVPKSLSYMKMMMKPFVYEFTKAQHLIVPTLSVDSCSMSWSPYIILILLDGLILLGR